MELGEICNVRMLLSATLPSDNKDNVLFLGDGRETIFHKSSKLGG